MQKKLISLATLLCFSALAFSQDDAAKKAEESRKMEPEILKHTNYILSNPLNNEDEEIKKGFATIVYWMTNTPDFTFEVDEPITKVSEKETGLMGVFLSAMAKYALENRDKAKDTKDVRLNAYTMLLDYCENEKNKVKKNKELKKMLEAKKEGKLKEYLNL